MRALLVLLSLLVVSPAEASTAPVLRCDGCWPTALAFTPRGELFYLERYSGDIHRLDLRTGRDRVWGSVGPVSFEGERGALGLALDPRWREGRRHKRTRWAYVYYTHAAPLENRVVRVRKRLNGKGLTVQQLITIPFDASSIPEHNGGPMAFGPDGHLYILTGDQTVPARAQEVNDLAGKTLRIRLDGSIPGETPVYSYGHRNAFGLTFDPYTGALWETDNGPQCDDEVNLIVPGNYGWGQGSSCPDTSSQGPSPIQPAHEWTPTIAPTGVAFDANGDLLVGAYVTRQILRLTLDAERDAIAGESVAYTHDRGILALARHPDGRMFFSDSEGIHVLAA